jgi:hypothetical protein
MPAGYDLKPLVTRKDFKWHLICLNDHQPEEMKCQPTNPGKRLGADSARFLLFLSVSYRSAEALYRPMP